MGLCHWLALRSVDLGQLVLADDWVAARRADHAGFRFFGAMHLICEISSAFGMVKYAPSRTCKPLSFAPRPMDLAGSERSEPGSERQLAAGCSSGGDRVVPGAGGADQVAGSANDRVTAVELLCASQASYGK
jgi:hypothetical protein